MPSKESDKIIYSFPNLDKDFHPHFKIESQSALVQKWSQEFDYLLTGTTKGYLRDLHYPQTSQMILIKTQKYYPHGI